MTPATESLVTISRNLSKEVDRLMFAPPVAYVYNPLTYAREPHEEYLRRYGAGPKRVLFWGMNPGPWGMAQTGVPFGEVNAVRDWMGISGEVESPVTEHPARPISGFGCTKSEVSGRRLWGLMASRFGSTSRFFSDHLVMNYCPLVFMEPSGRNRTPDKLPAVERETLFAACDRHLSAAIKILQPEWIIGVGAFAHGRIRRIAEQFPGIHIDAILHPSPASPRANRDWAGEVTRHLEAIGVWER